ncbi:MAG: TfoX/Sxy family protein [Acidimicrobiia bacterium]|jgi:TfoX/Sxy family transcriptional regulator of competence genes
MAFDETLATRIRDHIGDHPALTERKMFGGIAFMIQGNMAVGVSGDDLMVRIDPATQEATLARPGVRLFDMTGRPMRGWVLVSPESTRSEEDLAEWIETGVDFALSLPAK